MPKVTPEQVEAAYARYNKGAKWTREDLHKGINEEFEHGSATPETNVTNDDLEITTKIAVAHLRERDDFYEGLSVVDKAPRDYWRGRSKVYWRDHQMAAIIIGILVIIALYESIAHFIAAGTSAEPIFWAFMAVALAWVLIKIV